MLLGVASERQQNKIKTGKKKKKDGGWGHGLLLIIRGNMHCSS